MAEGNAEPSTKSLFRGIFECCFPKSRGPPVDPVPAASQHELIDIHRNRDTVGGTGGQSLSEVPSVLTDGPHPRSPAVQTLPPGDPAFPPPSGPPSEPGLQDQHIAVDSLHSKRERADLLKGALGITYDVAKIVVGNFSVPGLPSVIGLVDYVRKLREVRCGGIS